MEVKFNHLPLIQLTVSFKIEFKWYIDYSTSADYLKI